MRGQTEKLMASAEKADILIRPYELDDIPDVFAAARESISDVYEWLPWCHPELEIRETEEWITSQIKNRQEGAAYEFAILDKDNNFLGGCGLHQIDKEQRSANLGYWVRSSAMGQGVAPQATKALASWAFEHTDLERLVIVCALGNTRSQRVAEKAGAIREGIERSQLEIHGVMHDVVVYSILKPE